MPFNCFAPATGCTQLARCGAYNSRSGFASLNPSRVSNTPTLKALLSPKVGVSRHMVVPQSPQKKVSIDSPESAFFFHDLGLPDVT